jgi:hypothetical protein
MTKSIEKCKCALSAFKFGDDTERLKFFLKDAYESKSDDLGKSSRSFSVHVLKQLKNDVENIKESCGTDIRDAVKYIDGSIAILNQREGKLNYSEYAQIDALTGRLDGEILPDLKACAYSGKKVK